MGDASYSFTSNPRAVAAARKPYREPSDNIAPPSMPLHSDPRVRRGPTHGQSVRRGAGATAGATASSTLSSSSTMRRTKPRKQTSIFNVKPKQRERIEIDLNQFLIEQTDEVTTAEEGTNTDAFIERPETPPYVPLKTGVDASTAVDAELFDFDSAVEPLVDVLTYKTLEESLKEVQQEMELSKLERKLDKLHAGKRTEQEKIEGMEKSVLEAHEKKRAMVAKAREALARKEQAIAKIAALERGTALAAAAMTGAIAMCESENLFKDPVKEDIELNFMPNLYKRMQKRLETKAAAYNVVDDLLRHSFDVANTRLDKRWADEAAAREAERKRLEEEERNRATRVFVKLQIPDGEPITVGPVVVRRMDSVGTCEQKIRQWLLDHPSEDTETLMADGGTSLHLCSAGKPIDPEAALLEAVAKARGKQLELLPIVEKTEGDEDGEDGDEAEA